MRRILAAALIVGFSFPTHAQSHKLLSAASVAYEDYSKKLEIGKSAEWEYSAYVSNISNYSVGLSEAKNAYVVVFQLKKASVKINGSGGVYYIDKESLRILRFAGYE